MKKIIVTTFVIIAFIVYAIFYQKSPSSALPTTSSSSSSTTKGSYKDGAYTGSATDAFYGTLQVKATITNGNISDVTFLQYPNDQAESVEVNKAAMPTLKQEAITVQNSNVDIVSGATQTSQAFKESLASALTQAK